MNWIVVILASHHRMRGLSESQLRELIEVVNTEGLRTIKDHLERGSFRYQHIEKVAPELIARCIERAKELLWKQNEPKAREAFLAAVGDPFVV